MSNDSAVKSGLRILPFLLSLIVFSGISGAIASKTGRVKPIMIVGPMFTAVGAGLMYTCASAVGRWRGLIVVVTVNSNNGQLYGYQVRGGHPVAG